jgi:hypothetical protein
MIFPGVFLAENGGRVHFISQSPTENLRVVAKCSAVTTSVIKIEIIAHRFDDETAFLFQSTINQIARDRRPHVHATMRLHPITSYAICNVRSCADEICRGNRQIHK